MILFPSQLGETLNGRPHRMDRRFGRAMLNPHYRNVTVDPFSEILVDSGAFQKKDMINRLTPEQAFKRQRRFEFDRRPIDGRPWRFVTYDCLRGVDEALIETESGISRIKVRGSEETAREAVHLTVEAAEYYASRAEDVEGGIAYSAQGATIRQYMACVRQLLALARPGKDWLALGGFCILGVNRKLLPQFLETCELVAPLAHQRGLEQVHVLGVAFPDALLPASAIFRKWGLRFSTDTSGFELQAVNGKEWNAANIGDCSGRRRGGPYLHRYSKAQKYSGPAPTPLGMYNPCELLALNLSRFIEWAAPL